MLEVSRLETLILRSLRSLEDYSRQVLPYLKETYFTERSERLVFELIRTFILKYNSLPTHEALVIQLTDLRGKSEDEIKEALQVLETLEGTKDIVVDHAWLMESTEKFCQDKALYLALTDGIAIYDDKSGKTSRGDIPKIMSDALGVSFNSDVGHDYFKDSAARFASYHRKLMKIPFEIDLLNEITNGGVESKTFNLIQAATNVGKTMAFTSLAAGYLRQGYDVVYFSGEMADMKIGKRIDANLLDIGLDELDGMPEDKIRERFDRIKQMIPGRLIIKEFPTASASVVHLRAALDELRLKQNFRPKICIIDYIGVFVSNRVSLGKGGMGMYEHGKAITEEMRGLMVEYDMCGWSGVQTNRDGATKTDQGINNTAESWATPQTVDFQVILINSPELVAMNQILWRQGKNRYGDVNKIPQFVTGVDRNKQRFYNVIQPDIKMSSSNRSNTKIEVNLSSNTTTYEGWRF